MFVCQERAKIFFGGEHQILAFLSVDFFQQNWWIFPAELETKTTLGRSGGKLLRKIFKNLRSVMAILILFEQIFRSILFKSFALIVTSSPNTGIMLFVRTFSIHAWLKRKNYSHRRGSKLWKNTVFIRNIVKNGWWGGCTPSPSGTILLSPCLNMGKFQP